MAIVPEPEMEVHTQVTITPVRVAYVRHLGKWTIVLEIIN